MFAVSLLMYGARFTRAAPAACGHFEAKETVPHGFAVSPRIHETIASPSHFVLGSLSFIVTKETITLFLISCDGLTYKMPWE